MPLTNTCKHALRTFDAVLFEIITHWSQPKKLSMVT